VARTAQVTEERARQRRQWERVASSVSDFFEAPTTQYYRRCEIALLGRCVGPLAGKRVLKLDLWNEAFNTRILHWMRAEGAETFGLDLSQVVAVAARRNGRAIGDGGRLVQADIREVPFDGDSFDVVYTMGSIVHIAEYRHALAEVARVLRPGGVAVVGVPHRWNLFLRPLMVRVLSLLGLYLYAPEKSFSAGELARDLTAAGLAVRRRDGILAIPGLVRMADLFCHTRRIPIAPLVRPAIAPFAYGETRWSWPGRFGYLLALAAAKPGHDSDEA